MDSITSSHIVFTHRLASAPREDAALIICRREPKMGEEWEDTDEQNRSSPLVCQCQIGRALLLDFVDPLKCGAEGRT